MRRYDIVLAIDTFDTVLEALRIGCDIVLRVFDRKAFARLEDWVGNTCNVQLIVALLDALALLSGDVPR